MGEFDTVNNPVKTRCPQTNLVDSKILFSTRQKQQKIKTHAVN